MDLFNDEAVAVLAPQTARCPNCDRLLGRERTCWRCCDRLCRSCNRPTGSAFIAVCWSCWFKGAEDSPPTD